MIILEIIEDKKNDYIAKNARLPNTVIMPYRDYDTLFEEFCIINNIDKDTRDTIRISNKYSILGLNIIKSHDVEDIKVGYIEE